MNPVTHIELPYQNAGRISDFYKTVFGWELEPLGAEMGNYLLATTATEDVKPGAPAGSINGGLYPHNENWPDQYPSLVIGVGDLDQSMKLINENGGEVIGKPQAIPSIGNYVAFLDSEGSRLNILQPLSRMN